MSHNVSPSLLLVPTLTTLDLVGNNIREQGAQYLSETLKINRVGLQQHTVVRTQHRGPQQQGPQHESQQGSQQEPQQEPQQGSQHGSQHELQHELQQGLLQQPQPQPQHDERQQAGILI
ncbi:unnamed protein product, partial [Adineta steineri]